MFHKTGYCRCCCIFSQFTGVCNLLGNKLQFKAQCDHVRALRSQRERERAPSSSLTVINKSTKSRLTNGIHFTRRSLIEKPLTITHKSRPIFDSIVIKKRPIWSRTIDDNRKRCDDKCAILAWHSHFSSIVFVVFFFDPSNARQFVVTEDVKHRWGLYIQLRACSEFQLFRHYITFYVRVQRDIAINR